jgi:hypothetical protein
MWMWRCRSCLALKWLATVPVLALAFASQPAFAYRPFDGTDAAVATEGEMEIEFQPAGASFERSQTTLIGPATRINYGFAKGWEAVLEGQVESPLWPSGPTSLSATGAFLKSIVRPGSLQDQSGVSVATEFGALLPEVNGDPRWGASAAAIFSERWNWGAVHLNLATELTREHRGDIFVGTIVEGPAAWVVRPVAEIFYERELGKSETISGLVGLIWQVKEDLAFDLGVRHAVTSGHSLDEIRAGVSFGFPITRLVSTKR